LENFEPPEAQALWSTYRNILRPARGNVELILGRPMVVDESIAVPTEVNIPDSKFITKINCPAWRLQMVKQRIPTRLVLGKAAPLSGHAKSRTD